MANEKIIGITLNGTDYDYEDSETKTVANENAAAIGVLDDLDTDEKSDLVAAINEVNESAQLIQKSPRLPGGTWVAMSAPADDTIDEWNEKSSAFWEYLDDLENGYYRVIIWQDVFGESGDGFGTMFFAGQGSVTMPSGDYGEVVASFSVHRVTNTAIDWWLNIFGKSGTAVQFHSMSGRVIGGQLVDWRLDGQDLSESGMGALELEVSLQKIE